MRLQPLAVRHVDHPCADVVERRPRLRRGRGGAELHARRELAGTALGGGVGESRARRRRRLDAEQLVEEGSGVGRGRWQSRRPGSARAGRHARRLRSLRTRQLGRARHRQRRRRGDPDGIRSWRCRGLSRRLSREAARVGPRGGRDESQPEARSRRIGWPELRRDGPGQRCRIEQPIGAFGQGDRDVLVSGACAPARLPPAGGAPSQRQSPNTAAKLRTAAKEAVRTSGPRSCRRRRRAPMRMPLEGSSRTGSARPSLRSLSNIPPPVS